VKITNTITENIGLILDNLVVHSDQTVAINMFN